MTKKTNKALAVLLALVMVISLLPVSALATDYSGLITKQGDTFYYLQDGTPVTSDDGWMVSTSKTIAATGTENQYDITLQVQSRAQVVPTTTTVGADVVLVLDVSTSMDDIVSGGNEISPFWFGIFGGLHHNSDWTNLHNGGAQTRWEKMQSSIQTFLNSFLADPDNRVAIVVYGGSNVNGHAAYSDHRVLSSAPGNCWFTNAEAAFAKIHSDAVCQYTIDTQKEYTKNYPNKVTGTSLRKSVFQDKGTDYGATNIQAGFVGAGEAMENKPREGALPFVVFMSDGSANRSYDSNGYSTSSGDADAKASNELDDLVADYSTKVFGIAYDTSMSGNIFANSNMTSVAYSSSSGTTVLDNIFDAITRQIEIEIEAKPWTVTDNMSNLVVLDQSSVSGNPYVTVASNGKSFEWSIAAAAAANAYTYDAGTGIYTYTMTYTINVDPTQVGAWLDGGTVKSNETNGTTSLSYRLVVGGVEDPFTRVASFDIPEVTVNTYTVTFIDNYDGSTVDTQTVLYNGSAAPPARPSHTGYSTGDWVGTWQNVTQNETVVVYYEIYKYSIEYYVDGTLYDTVSDVDYDTLFANTRVPADPEKESTAENTFTFTGWVPSDGNYGANVREDRVYNALFTPVTRQYTVTFLQEDGSTEYRHDDYNYNSTIPGANIPVPTKDGDDYNTYTFSGWAVPAGKTYTVNSNVLEDMTFTATFSPTAKQYAITTSIDHGAITPTAGNYTAGTSPVISWTLTEGYEIVSVLVDGIDVTGSLSGNSYTFTDVHADHTVAVTTQKKTYTVTFLDYDNSLIESGTVEHGASYGSAPADPTRDSTDETVYTFLRWEPQGSYSLGDIGAVTRDMTFKAVYSDEEREYTVNFYQEGGGGAPLYTETYNYGDPLAAAPAGPSKSSTAEFYYTFAGWVDDENNLYETGSLVTDNMDFYATFDEYTRTYDVTFVLTGGPAGNITVTVDEDVPYGEDATLPTAAEIDAKLPAGYLFNDDWDTNYTSIQQDETVYGSISIQTFTVRFFVDGVQLGADQTVSYGGSATDPGYTAPDHYTFSGWDKSFANITEDTDVFGTTACEKYTVTFYEEGGTTVFRQFADQDYETDLSASVPVPPDVPAKSSTERYSYTFKKWAPVVGSGSILTELNSLDRNQSFVATYDEHTIPYSVTYYEADGATVIASLSKSDYGYGDAFTIAAGLANYQTVSTVYTWAGWRPGSGAYGTTTTSVTQNMTFTAQFNETVRQYTVTASIDNGGTISGAGTYNYNSDVTVNWNPAAGYHVTGVTVDGVPQAFDFDATRTWSFEDLAADHSVVVSTAINQYTVKFLDDDLSTISTQTVDHGGSATQPGDPTKTDATGKWTYTFAGWTVPADAGYTLASLGNVTQNMTFTASYDAKQNTAALTVVHVDGTGTNDLSSHNSSTTVNVGDHYKADPLPAGSLPTDYKLVGTVVTPTGDTEGSMPAGGVTVTYTYGPKSSIPVTVNYIHVAKTAEGSINIGGVMYSAVKSLGTATRSYLEDAASYDVSDFYKATYGTNNEYTFVGDDVGDAIEGEARYTGALDGAVTINLYYTINQHSLNINYVYANGTQAADPYEASYDYGSPYYVTSPTITSYTPSISIVSGTLTGNTTVTVTYTYNGGGNDNPTYYTVTVNYLDKDTGAVIHPAYTKTQRKGTDYDVTARILQTIATTTGVYGYDRQEGADVTGKLTGDKVINVYYILPEEELPDEPDVPGGDEPELPDEVIVDDGTPLGNLPQTGTVAEPAKHVWPLGMLAISLSMAAAGLHITFSRKKKEDEE